MKRRNFLHALIGVPVVVSLDSKTLLEAKEAEQDLVNSYSAVADVHRIRAAVMSEDPSRLSAEDRLLRKMYKPDWDAVERWAPRAYAGQYEAPGDVFSRAKERQRRIKIAPRHNVAPGAKLERKAPIRRLLAQR